MLDRLKAMQVSGRLDAAEATFRRMRDVAPDMVHAWLGLGYCSSLKGDAETALEAFTKAVAVCPDDEDATIACSQALSHRGAFDAARRILAGRSVTFAQQMALGALEERASQTDGAAACYRQASALDACADLPLRRLIDLHLRSGEYAAAEAVIDRLAALDPRHETTAWHCRGQLYRATQQWQSAISAFQRALDHLPNADYIAIDLSRALQAVGRGEEAYAVLADRPSSYRLSLALGDAALLQRNHDAALRHLAAAHALDPRQVEPLARSAKVEADRGECAAALAIADRIEAIGPEHRLAALRCRLETFRTEGEAESVFHLAEQMAGLVPADAGILAELARQYRLRGDARAARQAAQRALACDERSTAALLEAAEQAFVSDDKDAALEFRRRALHLAPENVAHHILLSRLLCEMDRVDEAKQLLTSAEARFGPSAELWGEHIRILREAGHSYVALREARRAQAAFPQHFGRWLDRFQLELSLSPLAVAEACCDAAPVKNRHEEAQLHFARASLTRRGQDIEGAIVHLKAGLLRQRHHPSIWSTLFELHMRLFDITEAVECFDKVTAFQAPSRLMRGTTTNGSQSLNGQLLNEFLIDRGAIAEVAAARKLDSAAELQRLLALVRKRPDHVPTAFGLLSALRRAGLLDRDSAELGQAEAASAIPKKIGQFWDEPELSEELLDLAASWRANNEDHHYYLFNADTARNYLRQHYPRAVTVAYRRCGDPETQADLFRLAFLLREGGVWADMDDRCLKPLSAFIPAGAQACFWQEAPGSIGNNFIAVVPGHTILRRALVTAVNAINRGDRDTVWMLTGPGLLSRAFSLDLAEAGDQWKARLDRITILDQYDITPNVAIGCRTAHKRLGKHWSKTAFEGSGKQPVAVSEFYAAVPEASRHSRGTLQV
jgi:tetratricopeptide (TPR) repeat protein